MYNKFLWAGKVVGKVVARVVGRVVSWNMT